MLSSNNKDEGKRSKLWWAVVLASTIIIILVIGFFITEFMIRNPLEGDWVEDKTGYYVEIDDDNELNLKGTVDGVYLEVDLYYTLDKDAKVITIKPITGSYEEAAQDTNGGMTAQEISQIFEKITTSFDYSLENDTLTLTEREYGDQFIFTRIKK